MSSKVPDVVPGSSGIDAGNLDLWKLALSTLSVEDRKQFGDPSSNMLDVLKGVCIVPSARRAYSASVIIESYVFFADLCFVNKVQEATESNQKDCVSKGWTVYRNKDGEGVKLRHVLEKISVWVKEIIKIIDVGVSLDQSGYAALPWAAVKYITTVGKHAMDLEICSYWRVQLGFSEIDEFSKVAEGIESVSGLITRYTIVEKLYLNQSCDARYGLQEAITKLYAATLTYLAKVKAYCTGNTLSMCLNTMAQERILR